MTHRKYCRAHLILVLTLAFFFHGCRKDDSPAVTRVEQPVTTPAPPPQTDAAPVRMQPASAADVQAALKRVFSDDVRTGGVTAFVIGDFNGDGSEDLAVVVHPSPGKLSVINDELSNWI